VYIKEVLMYAVSVKDRGLGVRVRKLRGGGIRWWALSIVLQGADVC
jgi:hypothetical protein